MNKKAKILLFCMIFVAGGVFSQIPPPKKVFFKEIYSIKPAVQNQHRAVLISYFHLREKNPAIPVNQVPFFIIDADHYSRNFGFFCKKELQFEKATKLPLKFRLGSVQYCDWMEGKKAAGILPGN